MNFSIKIFAFTMIVLMTGCASQFGPIDREGGTVSEWQSTVRATTNAVNNTAPAFNNMNTCPPGMTRVNHTAGGGGDAFIVTTETGSKSSVSVTFGTGHGCMVINTVE